VCSHSERALTISFDPGGTFVVIACASCGAENSAGQRFCGQCGSPLSVSCPACGQQVAPGNRFCGHCGTAVSLSAEATTSATAVPATAVDTETTTPVAERRRVSVMFADLVGFTTLSEHRDPEEVRELLSAYFEVAKTVISRYGGTVEKFIGDAVMAVWGTPIARENDAERAVRAALDLVDAVAALGESQGMAELRLRAGVVSGGVAVTIGATGQGMVAGDIVNTASRVQSIADPGRVLVDESTRAASSEAVAYRHAGEHLLKGKAEPIVLYAATTVVSGAGGFQRADGLESPFTGRERELRVVKELFHDSAEHGRARLVAVSGPAGVGKSRIAWEFFKYVDGLPEETTQVLWHVGRCLSYGEGVAYWALAEMFRMRFRIAEGDPEGESVQRMDAGLDEYIDDPEERAWLRPRLAALLGLGDALGAPHKQTGRDDLFAGWRLFLERLAERSPVVLVFEDLQWADEGLMDFIDYLLDWSASSPLLLLALARPELDERRPGWSSRRRNATTLYLDPMDAGAIARMVEGLVTGLSPDIRDTLAARAEGVPLYAIETVRMLIDRDLVVPRDGEYVMVEGVEDIDTLGVPATLHALIAARLDNLPEIERRLVHDASVLGLSFTPQALIGVEEAVGGSASEVERLLAELVRKEIFKVQADPRSPESGQYKFVQKVTQTVAYETLSRRDRRERHLAAAVSMAAAEDADDLAGVLATHYLAAADAMPDASDAPELRSTARHYLVGAARRAAGLAATDEALRYYRRALELVDDPAERADLAEQAGMMALATADSTTALEQFIIAGGLYESLGDRHAAARLAAREGDAFMDAGRFEEGIDRMEQAYELLAGDEVDADVAALAVGIGAGHSSLGRMDEAERWAEVGAASAAAVDAPEVLGRALNMKGIIMLSKGRRVEGIGLLKVALDLGLEREEWFRAVVQYGNLASVYLADDLAKATEAAAEGRTLAARIGDRRMEHFTIGMANVADLLSGRWDELAERATTLPAPSEVAAHSRGNMWLPFDVIRLWRGEPLPIDAPAILPVEEATDPNARGVHQLELAVRAAAAGQVPDALDAARASAEAFLELHILDEVFPLPWTLAVEAALELRRHDDAEALIAIVADRPPGLIPPLIRSQASRFRARLRSDDTADDLFEDAVRGLHRVGALYWEAAALTDHAESLARRSQDAKAQAVAAQAVKIASDLRATPLLARAQAVAGEVVRAPA
jgi:class 3 adenylate cyclase/tetratricopeptide (TPR) repeat protein